MQGERTNQSRKRRTPTASPPRPPPAALSRSLSSSSSKSAGDRATKSARLVSKLRSPGAARAARKSATEAALKREEERVEQEAAAALATQRKLAPFLGLCWWCLLPGHDPDKCSVKPSPDMSDFEGPQRPTVTRSKRPTNKQTTRSVVEQARHRAASKAAHKQRSRALETAAKTRARALTAERTAPLVGSGPYGQFTTMELIAIEFALELQSHLSEAQLAKDAAAIDRAALQIFARRVKRIPTGSSSAPFKTLDSLREPGEATLSSAFFLLHLRTTFHEAEVRTLLDFHRRQARQLHLHCAEVQALPADATLLAIYQEGAAKPPRGRPVAAAPSEGGAITARANWDDGGYSMEAIDARARFEAEAINTSLKRSQACILAATNLMVRGFPTTLDEFRACSPSKRPGAIACASTAALHAAQLNEYHVEEAAAAVDVWFPFLDAGSKRGVSGLMVGATGILRDVESHSLTSDEDIYQDALGLEILTSKTGAASAASLLRVFERRGVEEYYFLTSDAALDMTGHLSGVIAFVRRRRKCVAVYVNRCLAHITARSLKHMLQAEKKALPIESARASLKRKQARAKVACIGFDPAKHASHVVLTPHVAL